MRKSDNLGTGIAIEAFLDALRAAGLSAATVATRRDGLRSFAAFLAGRGAVPLQDVTPEALAAFVLDLRQRGCAENTLGTYLASVRALLGWMETRGLLFDNPARRVAAPAGSQPLPHVPPERDVRRLLEQPDSSSACGRRDRALIEMLYSAGISVGELVRLDLADADPAAGLVRVKGKGGTERLVPLGRNAADRLRDYLCGARPALSESHRGSAALWLNRRGGRLSRTLVERLLRRYCRAARIEPPITPHALRRAAATHMLRNGASRLPGCRSDPIRASLQSVWRQAVRPNAGAGGPNAP